MLSRQNVFAVVAATLIGVFAYAGPAPNADRALIGERPGITNNATIVSDPIETVMDAETSAPFVAEWCGLCGGHTSYYENH